jgi:hypothetical protein
MIVGNGFGRRKVKRKVTDAVILTLQRYNIEDEEDLSSVFDERKSLDGRSIFRIGRCFFLLSNLFNLGGTAMTSSLRK